MKPIAPIAMVITTSTFIKGTHHPMVWSKHPNDSSPRAGQSFAGVPK